jgi:protein TonB
MLLSVSQMYCQVYINDTINEDDFITIISEPPRYKVGNAMDIDADSLKNFIRRNIIYPESAINDSIEGNVYVAYWIDTLGQTHDHRILRGIRDDLDEEALRVTKLIRFEKPAMQLSRPIKIQYSTRVAFKLNKNDDEKKSKVIKKTM